MSSNEKLVKEILSGSESAMEILVNKNYKLVYGFIYRNVGDYHTALDLTQESFIKMMRGLHTFKKSRGNWQAWLLKIALNVCRDYWKSAYVRKNVLKDDYENSISTEDNVINYLNKIEERQIVKEAMLSLPEEQRVVLVLRYYHDLKIKEIADLTEINESTIKSRMRLGIKKLKKILKGGAKSAGEQESV